jgi:hypothetical protein
MADNPDGSDAVVKLVKTTRLELLESSRNNAGKWFKKPSESAISAQVQAVCHYMPSLKKLGFTN